MEPIKKVIKQSSVQIDRERETFANTLGITGVQMTTLDFISNHQNQTVSQHEIEKELDLKRSTVTIMIQRMEKRDLVKRVTNAVDKRQKDVSLTAKSKSLIPKIKDYMRQDDRKVRSHFTQAEINTALKVLKFVKNGEKMESNNERISSKVFAAVIATGLMSFSGVLVETSMNIAFPTLMRDFNVSTNVVQWMTSIYLLAVSIIVPISAALKSSYKTKSLFLTANFLFLLGLIVDATAPIFPVLLLGRVIQGIGTGIALPLMFNIILEQVPKGKVGTMMGVGSMITGIAPALGPTFGGIVLQELNWR